MIRLLLGLLLATAGCTQQDAPADQAIKVYNECKGTRTVEVSISPWGNKVIIRCEECIND